MPTEFPRSTASIGGHPIHPMLIPFPIAFLVGALVTDIASVKWASESWAYASTMLIAAGIVTGLLAAVFGFIDFFGEKRIRDLKVAWMHMIGNLAAVLISIVNFLVHSGGDGTVSSTGLALSALVVLILLFTGWLGGHMVYRHGVAVRLVDEAATRMD